jgi:hypothetical protein
MFKERREKRNTLSSWMVTVLNGDYEFILDRMEDSGSFSSEFTFLELRPSGSLVVPLKT